MGKPIYRYISFAHFVDMVQTKSLCFVNPIKWDDTYEMYFLHKWYDTIGIDDSIIGVFFETFLYAQSWSALEDESDAMWRIYSYDNQSLRIKIDVSDAENLNDVVPVEVKYDDAPINFDNDEMDNPSKMLQLVSQKRKAFEHEKEIRLIHIPLYSKDELTGKYNTRASEFVKRVLDENSSESIKNFPKERFKQDLMEYTKKSKKDTKKIQYDHIPNFIKGVLVNPLAPEWYVNTVKTYCDINKIPFEGQSKLYGAAEE